MDNNTFWILVWVLLTPFGWVGLLCSGLFVFLCGSAIGVIIATIRNAAMAQK